MPYETRNNYLRKAISMSDQFGRSELAIQFSERMLKENPNDYKVRRQLSKRLLREGRLEEAEVHLKWCLARTPSDEELQKDLRVARADSSAVLR